MLEVYPVIPTRGHVADARLSTHTAQNVDLVGLASILRDSCMFLNVAGEMGWVDWSSLTCLTIPTRAKVALILAFVSRIPAVWHGNTGDICQQRESSCVDVYPR